MDKHEQERDITNTRLVEFTKERYDRLVEDGCKYLKMDAPLPDSNSRVLQCWDSATCEICEIVYEIDAPEIKEIVEGKTNTDYFLRID